MSYLSFVIRDKKWGVVLGMRVVMFLGGELVIGDIFVRGIIFVYEGCSEDFLYLFFSLLFIYIVLTL